MFTPIIMLLTGVLSINTNHLFFIFTILALFSFFTQKITVKIIFQVFLTLFLCILMFVIDTTIPSYGFDAASPTGPIFYFANWLFFFLYMQTNYEYYFSYLKQNLFILKSICNIWTVLVIISFALPSSYSANWDGIYFKSLAGAEHVFASSCLFVLAIGWLLAVYTKDKRYYLYTILPIIGATICGARTYFGMAMLAAVGIVYYLLDGKKIFYWLIPVLAVISVPVILMTPIWDKFVSTLNPKGDITFWSSFTNSRSLIWAMDLETFFNDSWFIKLFGGGALYDFKVHAKNNFAHIWSHNDMFHILLTSGLIGLYLYFSTFFNMTAPRIKTEREKNKYAFWLVILFYSIWLFNSFFNGTITYLTAVYCIPVYLYVLNEGAPLNEQKIEDDANEFKRNDLKIRHKHD